MTKKRFRFDGGSNCIDYDGKSILLDSYGEKIEELLNELHEENERLKQSQTRALRELLIYRKIASCNNCKYQNYDWFEDGDEFEICEKGNSNQQIEYHICKDWRGRR